MKVWRLVYREIVNETCYRRVRVLWLRVHLWRGQISSFWIILNWTRISLHISSHKFTEAAVANYFIDLKMRSYYEYLKFVRIRSYYFLLTYGNLFKSTLSIVVDHIIIQYLFPTNEFTPKRLQWLPFCASLSHCSTNKQTTDIYFTN